ncbi:MAG TPA: hypothetical protein VMR62_20310 [Bryobacteraceae bacterium]|nr:hypothetical protein [Bryobacteraceae bacterium]
MKNCLARFSLPVLLLGSIATAATFDVTNSYEVTVTSGASLIFYISSDNMFPGEVEMLLGAMPLGGPMASIPGTSEVYMPGFLFTGTIDSVNGAVSIPLTDPDASRLGLPAGDILLTPGWRSGGSYSGSVDLFSADVSLSPAEAAALFSGGEFVIDLHNIGAPITLGYPGTTIANDFSASLTSADGSRSLGARALSVGSSSAPEPGTIGFLIIGLTIVGTRLGKAMHDKRLAKVVLAAAETPHPSSR